MPSDGIRPETPSKRRYVDPHFGMCSHSDRPSVFHTHIQVTCLPPSPLHIIWNWHLSDAAMLLLPVHVVKKNAFFERQLLWLKSKKCSLNSILQAYVYWNANAECPVRTVPQERQMSTGALIFEKASDNVCETVTLPTIYWNPCEVPFLAEMLAVFCTMHKATHAESDFLDDVCLSLILHRRYLETKKMMDPNYT
jgi:hypothetical protein